MYLCRPDLGQQDSRAVTPTPGRIKSFWEGLPCFFKQFCFSLVVVRVSATGSKSGRRGRGNAFSSAKRKLDAICAGFATLSVSQNYRTGTRRCVHNLLSCPLPRGPFHPPASSVHASLFQLLYGTSKRWKVVMQEKVTWSESLLQLKIA